LSRTLPRAKSGSEVMLEVCKEEAAEVVTKISRAEKFTVVEVEIELSQLGALLITVYQNACCCGVCDREA
jgi:hypothetical protein